MLSFLTSVLAWVEKGKQYVNRSKLEDERIRSNLKNDITSDMSEERKSIEDVKGREKRYKEKNAKSRAKMLFLMALTFVLNCIEWAFRLLISLMTFSGLLFLIIALGVFITFTSFITFMNKEEGDINNFDAPTVGGSLTSLAWTEEELAQYGANLSEYEKNLYRLGIYMSNAFDGYDGQKGFDFPNAYMAKMFMWGTDSMETGLRFYTKNQQDLGKVPSDINGNGIGYGFLGLHTRNESMDSLVNSPSKTLKIRASQRDGVKAKYVPSYTVSAVNNYAPYGSVVMAAKWNNKYYDFVTTKDTKDGSKRSASEKIDAVLDAWGIQNNREEVKQFMELNIAQAQFHGAAKTEHEAYSHFIAAFYCATSDNDAERSFDKWKLVGNGYGESAARKSMLGLSGGFRTVSSYGTPSNLPQEVGSIQWELNGQLIGKPLWTFLWEKFSSNEGMKKVWSTCTSWGNRSGIGDRVLNFHYGLNSYYMAKKMETDLIAKMGIPQTSVDGSNNGVTVTQGNFTQTPGKGQATLNGKTTEQLISEYKGGVKSYLQNLVPHFGKTTGMADASLDKMFGVPFYGQGSRFGESYGTLGWYPGCATYNRSGCMVYAYSYALSAMTGKLINPPETGAILIMNGGLGGSGAVMSKWSEIFRKYGLQSSTITGGGNGQFYGTKYFPQIDETLAKGGVVIMRAGGKPYAAGSNHYLVITGKHGDKYSIWTSTHKDQTSSLHTAQQLGSKMHRELVMVWK